MGRRFRAWAITITVLAVLGVGTILGYRFLTATPGERHRDLQNRAVEEMRRGNHDAARILLLALDAEGGATTVDRVNLAISLEATGRSDEALALLERIVTRSPGSATARSRLASLLYARGDLEPALAHATAALAKLPGDANARLTAGLAAFDLGQTATARVHLKRVRATDPGRTEALLRLATLGGPEARNFRTELDRRIADELRRRPDSVAARTLHARSLDLAGKGKEALDVALGVLEKKPDEAACLSIAIRHLDASSAGTVDRLLNAAAERMGESLPAALRAMWRARHVGPDEALAGFAALPREARETPAIRHEEVRLLALTGRLVAAVDRLADRPERPAVEAIVRALERAPGHPDRRKAAERLLDLLHRGARTDPASLAFEARLYMVLGRFGEANDLLDRPEVSGSLDPVVRTAVVIRLILEGRVEQALREVERREDALSEAGLVRLAAVAVRTRRPIEALRLLDRIETTPPPAAAIRTRAMALLALDRIAAAEKLLRGADSPRLVLLHADALFRLGRAEEADRRALGAEAAGALAASRALRAWWAEVGADRDEAARRVFDESLAIEVRRRAVLGLAEKCDREGRPDARLYWLSRAHEDLPAHPDVLGRLAIEEQRRGLKRPETLKLAAAVRSLEGRAGGSLPLRLAAATYGLLDGKTEEARRTCASVLAAAPFDPDARRLAALVALREGRREEAVRHLRTLVSLRPADRTARGLLNAVDPRGANAPDPGRSAPRAALYAAIARSVEGGDLGRARSAFLALGLKREAEFVDRLAQCRAAIEGRRFDAAEEAARAMVDLRPGSPAAQYRLGLVLLLGKGPDAATGAFREAARRAPEWMPPVVALVRALVASGRREAAREYLMERLEGTPEDALAFALLSEVRAAGGDPTGAIAFARRAVEIGGADAIAHPALVRALHDGRSAEEAWTAARSFVDGVEEPDPRDLALAGQAALAADRPDDAARLFSRSLDRLSSRTGMAEVLARRGETEAALTHAAVAEKMAPADPAVVFLHASLLDAAGRRSGAILGYERVLKLSEGHALAALHLARHLAEAGEDLDRALRLSAIALRALPDEPEAKRVRELVTKKAANAPSREGD